MKNIQLISLLIMLCLPTISSAQKTLENNKPEITPKWLQSHFEFLTNGTGRWIADNSKYKNENEPFDEYGTEWTWGVGKQSIKGHLFGIKDKKEVGTFWEYRVFWHPKEKRAIYEQFGTWGVFATGEMRVIELFNSKSENNVELTFYSPDGSSWKDLHKLIENNDEHTTQSYNFKDGSWKPQRTYIWKRIALK